MLAAELEAPEQIGPTVEKLESGEILLATDDELRARLEPRLAHAMESLPEADRAWAPILHWYRGKVTSFDLQTMGMDVPWHLPVLAPWADDREHLDAVLGRLAEAGLLRQVKNLAFDMQPGLPAVLRPYAATAFPSVAEWETAERAYAGAVADFAVKMGDMLLQGSRQASRLWLESFETNLQHAWRIAMGRGWIGIAIDVMNGLEEIYLANNRWLEWRQLIDRVEPLVTVNGDPHPDWGKQWAMVQEYRIRFALRQPQGRSDGPERAAALRRYYDRLPRPAAGTDDARYDERSRVIAILNEAALQMQTGQVPDMRLLQEALEQSRAIPDKGLENDVASIMAMAHQRAGNAAEAEQAMAGALRQAPGENVAESLALLELQLERLSAAVSAKTSAEEVKERLRRFQQQLVRGEAAVARRGTAFERGRLATLKGRFLYMNKKPEAALAEFQKALQVFGEDSIESAMVRVYMAGSLADLDRHREAKAYKDAAQRIAGERGLKLKFGEDG